MVLTLKIPLEQLIGKLLKGEVTALSEKRLYLYVENLTNGDKGKLRQVLKDIDDMVAKWKDGYFISVYEERVIAFNRSKLAITPQELDDIYHEENYLLKSGKIALSVDYLYESIAKYGFINEHHQDAVESACFYHDMEFLRKEWECLVLAPIMSLRDIVCSMLGMVCDTPKSESQASSRPLKRIEDYPEIFDLGTCCELTGYAKDTIYKWTRTKEIPCHRSGTNGRKLKFKRDEIVEWLTARKQETKDEFIKRKESELASRYIYNNL